MNFREIAESITSPEVMMVRLWVDFFADFIVGVGSLLGIAWIIKNWNFNKRNTNAN
jgi:hypothetical protein